MSPWLYSLHHPLVYKSMLSGGNSVLTGISRQFDSLPQRSVGRVLAEIILMSYVKRMRAAAASLVFFTFAVALLDADRIRVRMFFILTADKLLRFRPLYQYIAANF